MYNTRQVKREKDQDEDSIVYERQNDEIEEEEKIDKKIIEI